MAKIINIWCSVEKKGVKIHYICDAQTFVHFQIHFLEELTFYTPKMYTHPHIKCKKVYKLAHIM